MYQVYMGRTLLPIAPSKLTLKIKNQNKTLNLINEGEVNVLKDAGLTEIDFDVLAPAVRYSFATYKNRFRSPAYVTDKFEELKVSKEPFQFIVSREMPDGRLLFDTDIKVSLESYTITEQSSEGFDLKVSIKLKQYRPYSTKIVKVVDDSATVTETRDTSTSPAPKQETTYTVKEGDCLWNIARSIYGDGAKYTKIYEANKDKIINPNLIYPNQVLVIPPA
jgi:LysM repeat protein